MGRRENSLLYSPESRGRHLLPIALRYQEHQSEKRSQAGCGKDVWNEEAPWKSISNGHRLQRPGGQCFSKPFNFCPSFDPTIPLSGKLSQGKGDRRRVDYRKQAYNPTNVEQISCWNLNSQSVATSKVWTVRNSTGQTIQFLHPPQKI